MNKKKKKHYPKLNKYYDGGGILKDVGKSLLNTAAMPFEIATGTNFYDPKMETDLGVGIAKTQNTIGDITTAVAPTALNMVVPGMGTALSATQTIGKNTLEDQTQQGNQFNQEANNAIVGGLGVAANTLPMFMNQSPQGGTQFQGGGDLHYGSLPYDQQVKLYNYRKKYNETHSKYSGGDDPNMINKFNLDQTPEGQKMWKLAQDYGAAFIQDPSKPVYGKDIQYGAYENPVPKVPITNTTPVTPTATTPAIPIDPNWKYEAPKFKGFTDPNIQMGYNKTNPTAIQAYGGLLPLQLNNGGNLDMTEYNGLEHSQGGLPLGQTGNEVETGEARVGDYIFSDSLTPEGSISTFADIAKKINKKYIRDDAPSNRSKAKELEALMSANEESRLAKEALDNQMMSEDVMKYGGCLEYKNGGIFIDPSKRGSFTAAAKKRGMGISDFASKLLSYKNGGNLKYQGGGVIDPDKPELMYLPDTGFLPKELNYPDTQGVGIDFKFGVPNTQLLQNYNNILPPYNTSNPNTVDMSFGIPADTNTYSNLGAPELATPGINPNTQGYENAPQQKGYDFYDPNNKFGAKEVGLLTSNLSAFNNLIQGAKKPAETEFERMETENVDLSSQRQAAEKQAAMARNIQASNVRGNATSSGQALSNLAAGNSAITSGLQDTLLQSYLNEQNANVGINNQANRFNTQVANEEIIANEQNKAMRDSLTGLGLADVGQNVQSYMFDKGMQKANTKYNDQSLNVINQLTQNYRWGLDKEKDQYMLQFVLPQLNNKNTTGGNTNG